MDKLNLNNKTKEINKTPKEINSKINEPTKSIKLS